MKVLLLILIYFISFQSQAAVSVLIDPGHGGQDGGAKYNGITESKLVLEVSQELLTAFSKDPNFKAELTRNSDTTLSLSDRASLAKGYDVFLSLHANSSIDAKSRGLEIFVMNDEPSFTEEQTAPSKENDVSRIKMDLLRTAQVKKSTELGKALLSQWTAPLFKSPIRALKQENFFVLQNSVSEKTKAALLIELGFLNQPQDLKLLSNKKWQKQRAHEIYRAVRQHIENLKAL